jgi:hypothetical protein
MPTVPYWPLILEEVQGVFDAKKSMLEAILKANNNGLLPVSFDDLHDILLRSVWVQVKPNSNTVVPISNVWCESGRCQSSRIWFPNSPPCWNRRAVKSLGRRGVRE